MKKLMAKLTVLVLALLMIFSFGACTDNGKDPSKKPTPVSVNQVLDDAVDAMLAKSGFTLDADIDLTMPWIKGMTSGAANRMTVKEKAAIVKTTNDYDMTTETTMTMKDVDFTKLPEGVTEEDMTNVITVIKKGNVMYSDTYECPDDPVPNDIANKTIWESEYIDSFNPAEFSAQLKKTLAGAELGEIAKEADGTYKVTASVDYGKYLNDFQKFVADNKTKNCGEVLANLLGGKDYTKAILVADAKAMFADDITVSGMVTAVNTFLGHIGMQQTVKQIVDSAATAYGMTAKDLYALMGGAQNTDLKAPGANDTVYDFLMANFGTEKVDDLLALLADEESEPLTVAEIREMVLNYAESETKTFGEFYDEIIPLLEEMMMDYEGMGSACAYVLDMDKVETVADANDGHFLRAAQLANYTFGENKLDVELVLNADNTIKTLKVTFKNNISYKDGTETYVLGKSDVTATVAFGYENVPAVTEPVADFILPCMRNTWYVDELPETGDWVIEIYAGKGYTFEYDYGFGNNSEALTGITYANGKITVPATEVAKIRQIAENDGYAYFYFRVKQGDEDIEKDCIYANIYSADRR